MKSDLCVALGTELGEPCTTAGPALGRERRHRKWVMSSRTRRDRREPAVDVPLVGDLRGVVPQLVEALEDTQRSRRRLGPLDQEDAEELAQLARTRRRAGRRCTRPASWSRRPRRSPRTASWCATAATVIFQWTYSQAKPRDVIWNQNFGHLGTGLPYAVGASVAEGRKRPVMLLTSDSAFLFHIAELETAARKNLPLVCVVGVDHQWGLEVGVYKRTFEQPSPQPGVHWSKDVRIDKIAEGFGCHGEYVEKEDEIGPAIERAYASGKTAVVHVCIDPKANSEEMPKYDEFRTWYAEGTQ